MNKVKTFLSGLFRNDTFLKIFALILAVGVWLYIVNVADKKTERKFSDIPVTFTFEGTVPYNKGLMPLVTSKSYTVDVRISGPRTSLLGLSKDTIRAVLNFSGITESGTYYVPISVTVDDTALSVEIIGEEAVPIEFTQRSTVDLSVTFRKTGNYATGYSEISKIISPKTITVEGPKDIVDTIAYAEVQFSVANANASISQTADVILLNNERDYVDRTYLKISSSSVNVAIELAYRKAVKLSVNLVNTYGGDESSYVTATFDLPYIQLQGDEERLSGFEILGIGDVHLDEIKTNTKTFEQTLYLPEGLKSVDDLTYISYTIDMGDSVIKNVRITSDALADCVIKNIPDGKTASVSSSYTIVSFRSLPYVFSNIDVTQWSYYVDLDDTPDGEGRYPLYISLPDGVPGGFLSRAYVSVDVVNE